MGCGRVWDGIGARWWEVGCGCGLVCGGVEIDDDDDGVVLGLWVGVEEFLGLVLTLVSVWGKCLGKVDN